MKKIRIVSWNVNGIRAIAQKGFREFIATTKPDILALQETKATSEQLPQDLHDIAGYHSYWHYGERKGYSGVGLYSKQQPRSVITGFNDAFLDAEGRTQLAIYDGFALFNVYFPNGGMGDHRLQYKMEYYKHFLTYVKKFEKKHPNIIVCGDVNTAHKEIDIARPKENSKISGFLPQERAWIDTFINAGYIDTFREFNQLPQNYTWWDYKSRARDRNIGWRLDYFFISKPLRSHLISAKIYNDVYGSDHCPVSIELLL